MRFAFVALACFALASLASAEQQYPYPGAYGGSGGSVIREQSDCANATTPTSGTATICVDSDNSRFYGKDDGGTLRPFLHQIQGDEPTSGQLLQSDGNGRAVGVTGSNCDETTGICALAGITTSGANPKGYNGRVSNSALTTTVMNCVPFGNSSSWQNWSATGTMDQMVPLNQANAGSFNSLTVLIRQVTTEANFEADEIMSFRLYGCVLNGSADETDCTAIDEIQFEADATPDATYGADTRTAIGCDTMPCIGTIATNGGGLSPAGDSTFTAAQYDYFAVCSDDDTRWTADAGGGDSGSLWATVSVGISD